MGLFDKKISKEEMEEKVSTSIKIRGAAASIDKLSLPTVDNVIDIFASVGIKLKKG